MSEVNDEAIIGTAHRQLSNPTSQGPAKHHKVDNDHCTYRAELSTTSREQLMAWIKAPINGRLEEIPGVGSAAIVHLSEISEEARGQGTEEIIESTHQMIGKYLMLKGLSTDNVENAQSYYMWLKCRGIHSHLDSIVEAVAEKVNVMVPGSYMAELFEAKK